MASTERMHRLPHVRPVLRRKRENAGVISYQDRPEGLCRSWKGVLSSLLEGDLNERQRAVLREAANRIPEEIALSTAACGTPQDCTEQIFTFAKAGCRHIIFGVGDELSINPLAKSVIPYLREVYQNA